MIICVEDDSSIRDLMVYALISAGFDAFGCSDGKEFWEMVRKDVPQLVLLDIMLPGEDGISILKKMQTQPALKHTPVIMATAKGTEYDKVTGLDLGADDYLVKPFGMMEMVSRVRAVLRRSLPEEENTIYRAGPLEVNTGKHAVLLNHEPIQLTLKEYELLLTFMQNPGQVLTRGQLLFRIWGTEFAGETRTIDVHIGTLRTKLGICGEYIQTIRGVGYRLEPPS